MVNERAFKWAHRTVLESVKDDAVSWVKRTLYFTVALAIGTAILAFLRFDHMIASSVDSIIQGRLKPQIDGWTASVSTEVDKTREARVRAEATTETATKRLVDVETQMFAAERTLRRVEDISKRADALETKLNAVTARQDGVQTTVEEAGNAANRAADQVKDSMTAIAQNDEQLQKLATKLVQLRRDADDIRSRDLQAIVEQTRADLANLSGRFITPEQLGAIQQSKNPAEDIRKLSLPRVSLLRPISVYSDSPLTIFGDRARLEWRYQSHDMSKVEYEVQYGNTPELQSARSTTTIVDAADLEKGTSGRVYWRVRARHRDQESTGPGRTSEWSDTAVFDIYQDAVDRIRLTNTIRVGVSSSYEGKFGQVGKGGKELVGFDIELARSVCSKIGIALGLPVPTRVEMIGYNWNSLLTAPRSHEVDFIISTITIKPSRETSYGLRFSVPYYTTYQALIVPQGILPSPKPVLADWLRDRRIAVQDGTSSLDVARCFSGKPDAVVRVSSAAAVFDELYSARVECGITDYQFAVDQSQKDSSAKNFLIVPLRSGDFPKEYEGVRREEYGMAVSVQDAQLLTYINGIIEADQSSGELSKLAKKYDLAEVN